jgi:hypothetical protein
LFVGFCSDKSGEEAVMDVDNPVGVGMDDKGFQDLHITGENEEINAVADKIEYMVLVISAVFSPERKVIIRDAIHVCKWLEVFVIADNERDIHCQFATFPTPEQVGKAMVEL